MIEMTPGLAAAFLGLISLACFLAMVRRGGSAKDLLPDED